MIDDLIKEFDAVVEIVGTQGSNEVDCKTRLCELISKLMPSDEEGLSSDPERTLGLLAQSKHCPESTALLGRCVAAKEEWFDKNPWRFPLASFFDSHLVEFFRENKAQDLQNHEKIRFVGAEVRKVEARFGQAVTLLTSLDQVNVQQQNVFKLLNSTPGKVFLLPFLPDAALTHLSEIYTRTREYVDNKEKNEIVDIARRALDSLKERRDHFIGTEFSELVKTEIFDRLIDLIEQDFRKNPAVLPASIQIARRDTKKYPLHNVGQKIRVGITLKNTGNGFANNTSIVVVSDDSLNIETDMVAIGNIAPQTTYPVEFIAEIRRPSQVSRMSMEVSWTNFDGTKKPVESEIELESQRTDIDWDAAVSTDPYSLEAVTTAGQLVGRKELLDRILSMLSTSNMGSVYIKGQKRVGKTSIARVIQEKLAGENFCPIFLESGDFVCPDATGTIKALGERLTRLISASDARLANIPKPEFSTALSPITDYLDDVFRLIPNRKLLLIIDEFDELPADLVSTSETANGFFQTLRSISNRDKVGFAVIGGEKMDRIIDSQGAKINKWTKIQVDYFSRELDWTDYKDLIQRPTNSVLEYSENAIARLYELTAGNPFFTKLICRNIYSAALHDRDSHITDTEVMFAAGRAAREEDKNRFQHFWDDGIIDTTKREETSISRRRVLIALTDVLRQGLLATSRNIAEKPIVRDLASVETQLEDFVSRNILVSATTKGETIYDFKVPLFKNWLEARGVRDIISSFASRTAALQEREAEEKKKIDYADLDALAKKWKTYKGSSIVPDQIQDWLNQFGDNDNQRIALELLQNLRFYSESFIRAKMQSVYEHITRGGKLIHKIEGTKRRKDILVSYLDGPGKSGNITANYFVEENRLLKSAIVEPSKLASVLSDQSDIKALVFLDDFVGTGESASSELAKILRDLQNVIRERSVKVLFSCVVAFEDGWNKIHHWQDKFGEEIDLHVCELLDSRSQCFSDNSEIFSSSVREIAKDLVVEFGKVADKTVPLGYGELGLAVTFERNCPNNSLAILWGANGGWKPLFRRN